MGPSPAAPAARYSRLARLLPEGNLAGSLYGTVLVTSVLVGLGKSEREPGLMIATLVVTAVVFALAHAWATALGESARVHRPAGARALAAGFAHEWPLVQATLPAVVALALAGLEVYSVRTGLWVAFVANVALLFVWATALRRLAGGTFAQSLAAGLLGGMLGVVMILLKVLVH